MDVPTPNQISVSQGRRKRKIKWLEVKDFEGNHVQFIEESKTSALPPMAPDTKLVGHHIIHIGMAIRDRSEADQFYRDVLGFKLYWHGGMDPAKTDWVAMQVPDGTDWLEYMLTSGVSGSGIPYHISQNALGVLNHLSIGVPNMADAVATLKSENRVGPRGIGSADWEGRQVAVQRLRSGWDEAGVYGVHASPGAVLLAVYRAASFVAGK